jgi:SAM-dependent methyltransferase
MSMKPEYLAIKFFGYRLAKELSDALPPAKRGEDFVHLGSKLATQADIESRWFSHWMAELNLPILYSRKLWEFAYALQAIHEAGLLKPGVRALGFGCGQEPIASYLASRGVTVVVTDLDSNDQRSAGWANTDEHTASLESAYKEDLVDRETFDRLVTHRFVDMTNIPDDLREFDICWSICALEHLGDLSAGSDFVKKSLDVLRQGGIAVHTTEFNCLHEHTIESGPTVLYQRKHMETLSKELIDVNHVMAPCDFDLGLGPIDRTIDLPPYPIGVPEHADWLAHQMQHLKLEYSGFVVTCFGLSVIKGETMATNLTPLTGAALTSLEYNQKYYEEHKEAGLDYLGHGYWQESYGKMIAEATLQDTYDNPTFFDGGCACGSILTGFKKTGLFKSVLGVDLSDHMVNLGRDRFGLTDKEIVAGSITNIPADSDSISLVHSAQVLEHIPDDLTDAILDEFARILRPGGRAFLCLDAIRHGETKEMYMGDPTHFNIKPVMYWTRKLEDRGLYFDIEAYNRFVRSDYGPTEGDPLSFYQHYPYWSAWTLIKA